MNFSPPDTFILITHLSASSPYTGDRTCCPNRVPGSQTRVEHSCWSQCHCFILYSLNSLKSHQHKAIGLPLLVYTQQPQALEPSSLDQPIAGTKICPFLDAPRVFFSIRILKMLYLGMYFWTRFYSCPSEASCALWVLCVL